MSNADKAGMVPAATSSSQTRVLGSDWSNVRYVKQIIPIVKMYHLHCNFQNLNGRSAKTIELLTVAISKKAWV